MEKVINRTEDYNTKESKRCVRFSSLESSYPQSVMRSKST